MTSPPLFRPLTPGSPPGVGWNVPVTDAQESSAAAAGNLNGMRPEPEKSRIPSGAHDEWRFGPFQLERSTRRLLRQGRVVHLARRPFDVLEHLIAERPRLVSREELLALFWGGRDVYEEALTRCVSSIRKALDDRSDPPLYIETRWHEGYRFIADILPAPIDGPASTTGTAADEPPVQPPDSVPRRARRIGLSVVLVVASMALLAASWPTLRQLGTADRSGVGIKRLAVLPLRAEATEPWVGQGLADDLVQTLSRMEGLTIVAPEAAARALDDGSDLAEVGRALDVQALLKGAVRQDGERYVVSLQLLDTVDSHVLWAYESVSSQSEMAGARADIARRLATRLSARLRTPPPPAPRHEATYGLYLRARHLWNQRTRESLNQSIALFGEAIAAEPDYSEAHAGLAESWLLMPLYAGVAPHEAHPRARAAAQEALRLNPDCARAHAVLAVISSQFDWDWLAADEHFRQAVELDPNSATAFQWWAESLCFRRLFDRCQEYLREALALDPLSPILTLAQGLPARFSGDTEAARRTFEAVLRTHPSFAFAEYQLGLIASQDRDWDRAIAHLERALPAMGPILGGSPLGYAYARAGRTTDALRLRHDIEQLSAHRYVPPLAFAGIAMGFGDHDLALSWLERAATVHDDFLASVAVNHHFDDLHGDPRFEALLARVGLPTR